MKAVKSFVQNHTTRSSKDQSSTNSSTPEGTAAPTSTAVAGSMSASFKTILILGGTSGIGEAFAKRFAKQGKKVIVTGRRAGRLDQLKATAPNSIEIYVLDNNDFAALPGHLDTLFKSFPDIDTVWANGGIQRLSSIKDINSSSDADVQLEVTTNITAPFIIARHVIPKLIAKGSETSFLLTTSGLGFGPRPLYPVYNATKMAGHIYLVSLRQALKDSNVNLIEIVPPYVATELDVDFQHKLPKGMPPPMPLQEFEDAIFEQLDKTPAKEIKEVSAGSAQPRVDSWRNGFAELAKMGMGD